MDPVYKKDIKVLVVEDDEDDWLITKKIFSKIPDSSFVVDWAPNYDTAVASIDADAHDAYLVDYRLGERTGIDLLQYAHPESRIQPFILITGVSDSDVEWKSLKLAAADYLVKGSFDATLLSRTLLYALQRKYIEQQKIDQLVQLNQAKEEFISIASHQLRTPATSVKQYLGMVVEGFVGDVTVEQRQLLEKAYESNERQLRIIADLLKVAQVDSGKMKLYKSEVDINELLTDVVEEQRQIALGRKQSISFTPLKKTVKLVLDRDSLRMVLENIIDNAGKYSVGTENIEVTVSSNDDEVCINVIDQGVGIESEDTNRLYQKFSRISNPLSTKVGGSGLGLYWAKKIIDMHDGHIEYRPNAPRGSIFSIYLPIKNSELVHTELKR
jgi:signal transduction histidine kinase